jgi:hypothetical protein
MQNQNVKFVRINGRIVPIKQKSPAESIATNVARGAYATYQFDKHYRIKKDRKKSAFSTGAKIGAGVGIGITGVSALITSKNPMLKPTLTKVQKVGAFAVGAGINAAFFGMIGGVVNKYSVKERKKPIELDKRFSQIYKSIIGTKILSKQKNK